MGKAKLVYIAGALNSDAVHYIQNMHRMIKTARLVRNAGFSVYVPCTDILEGLVDGQFDYKDYFENSQPILARSDALFLTPGWEKSKGTQKEIEYAKELGIPVFDNIKDLKETL